MEELATIAHFRSILRGQLPFLADRYLVASLGFFGSFPRGEQGPESDLDILVSFQETPGLLRFIELENYLSDLLGVKVDLVLKDSLKSAIGRRTLAEVLPV